MLLSSIQFLSKSSKNKQSHRWIRVGGRKDKSLPREPAPAATEASEELVQIGQLPIKIYSVSAISEALLFPHSIFLLQPSIPALEGVQVRQLSTALNRRWINTSVLRAAFVLFLHSFVEHPAHNSTATIIQKHKKPELLENTWLRNDKKKEYYSSSLLNNILSARQVFWPADKSSWSTTPRAPASCQYLWSKHSPSTLTSPSSVQVSAVFQNSPLQHILTLQQHCFLSTLLTKPSGLSHHFPAAFKTSPKCNFLPACTSIHIQLSSFQVARYSQRKMPAPLST